MAVERLKFGGSSIADAEKIRHVGNIIRDKKSRDELVIVISAFGGVTDTLKDIADKAAYGKPKDQMYDSLIKRHRECIHDLNSKVNIDDQCQLDKYFIQFLQKKRPYERLDLITKAILIVGTSEIINNQSLNKKIIINEYVNIAKSFLNKPEVSLINAILDKIYETKN